MAKRTFATYGTSFVASALGSALGSSNYMGIAGGTTTQITDIDEILISGTASSSTVGAFAFVPVSAAHATATTLSAPNSDGANQSNATPVAQVTFIAASTNPTPSSGITAPKLNVGLNTFGGIIRWNAAPTQQYTLVGSAAFAAGPPATFGEAVLMNLSAGSGATTNANAHIIYEPY